MITKIHENASLADVHASVPVCLKTACWKRIFAFFGPAYLVSVGYMDPGNWATDLAGGSKFGYTLLWVLLLSNGIALLLQNMSARLGIVRGRDLAQANRETYPRAVNFALYLLAEIAIAACDLAEVLGMAIGINLLTGLPLLGGVGLTVLDTFLFLLLQRLGMRKLEAFILALIAIIGASFLIEILMVRPQLHEVVRGFIPRLPNHEALYIAVGIIGATVMPHNLYLHSALVQTRKFARDIPGIKQAIKWNNWDSTIALNLAFLVNAAILVLAATAFFKTGRTGSRARSRTGLPAPQPAPGQQAGAPPVRRGPHRLRAELHGDGYPGGPDRHGGLPAPEDQSLAEAFADPSAGHRTRRHRALDLRRQRDQPTDRPEPGHP